MYVQLTPDHEFTIKMVAQMLPQHCHVLSPFERTLCDEVVDRWVSAAPAQPAVSDAEWRVLEDAAQAMADDKAKAGRAAA